MLFLLFSCWLLVAVSRSNAAEPAVDDLSAASAAAAADAAEQGVRRLAALPYAERDGEPLLADVYLPAGEGPFPAVMMIHGGAWLAGSRWEMYWHARTVARAGYAVVSIDYRLAPGSQYPAQIDDCRAAWRWMQERAEDWNLDRDRMAVYGYSAGAHLACLVGLAPEQGAQVARPRAIVAGGAPCDFGWISPRSRALAYFLGGSREQRPETYRQASPVNHASADDPPVFLYHGNFDRLVPLVSPRRLQTRLREMGVRCDLDIRPGLGHVMTFFDPRAPRRAIAFLDEVIQNSGDERQRAATAAGSSAIR